jgi:hypothetical protein
MTPVLLIREIIKGQDYPDVEMIGARLQHHNMTLCIQSNICSDTGDKWLVEILLSGDKDIPECGKVMSCQPNLRTALADALDKACRTFQPDAYAQWGPKHLAHKHYVKLKDEDRP